jgi:hypothetical protein
MTHQLISCPQISPPEAKPEPAQRPSRAEAKQNTCASALNFATAAAKADA